jgi:hypothetical protein
MGEEYYPRLAPIMVGVTLVLFLGIMVLLGYRWMNMAEPNGFILVHGTKAFDGAEVTVSDTTEGTEARRLISAKDDYQLRFPLPQGTYRLAVTMNDKPLLKQPVSLREGSGLVFNLDEQLLATTQPSGGP